MNQRFESAAVYAQQSRDANVMGREEAGEAELFGDCFHTSMGEQS